ncbi:hypothetical protein M427DRAFT_56256 [Gonapodya prolifera JEL478]|uniref:Uncharacterized protein n=1 Tax=Gonapodya prolifera (strain JEL478) TaxID=1344416 RepID=A0A139AGM8_GONPJ|nr:hypothetical protein M427DRAFT_56256 [Gonapodya prolifera JEL478]|eukprot:KXS15956.1 hypothetical protein M427DRAFT_56256 [Gonapodya prolifera JEL478]
MEGTSSASSKRRSRAKTIDVVEDLSGAESAESGHPPEPGPIMVEERMRKRRPPSKSGRGNGEEDQTATILEPKMEGTSSASSKRRSRAKTIDVVEESTIKPVQQAQKDSMWEGATGDEHSAISLAPVVAKRTRAKFRTKGSGSR